MKMTIDYSKEMRSLSFRFFSIFISLILLSSFLSFLQSKHNYTNIQKVFVYQAKFPLSVLIVDAKNETILNLCGIKEKLSNHLTNTEKSGIFFSSYPWIFEEDIEFSGIRRLKLLKRLARQPMMNGQ